MGGLSMEALAQQWAAWQTMGYVSALWRSLLVLALAWLLGWLMLNTLRRLGGDRLSAQQSMIASRLIVGVLGVGAALIVLRELKFDLGALLGAAGILTVALGFAARTAAENLISGVFLVIDGSFKVGDMLSVGEVTGQVQSIDLLSVKVRTFDNKVVRIANESLLRSQFTNLSYHPIRRFDLQLSLTYEADINQVREALLNLAQRNPLCLDEPRPTIILQGFQEGMLRVQFSTWTARENFITLGNTIQADVKDAFDRAGIAPSYPQRVMHQAPTRRRSPKPTDG